MPKIYRDTAIEKLSSPDQLDKSIVLSSPLSWLCLIGIFIVIVGALAWVSAVFLPQTVSVVGIVCDSEDADRVCDNVVCYVPIGDATSVEKGDEAFITHSDKSGKEIGKVEGTVVNIDTDPASKEQMTAVLGSEERVNSYFGSSVEPVCEVTIKISATDDTNINAVLNRLEGQQIRLVNHMAVDVKIVTGKSALLPKLIPWR